MIASPWPSADSKIKNSEDSTLPSLRTKPQYHALPTLCLKYIPCPWAVHLVLFHQVQSHYFGEGVSSEVGGGQRAEQHLT